MLKNLQWTLEKYKGQFRRYMDSIEKFKTDLLNLIDENEYDEVFSQISDSVDVLYDKSLYSQLKNEYTGGQFKFDAHYAKRLKTFVNGLKSSFNHPDIDKIRLKELFGEDKKSENFFRMNRANIQKNTKTVIEAINTNEIFQEAVQICFGCSNGTLEEFIYHLPVADHPKLFEFFQKINNENTLKSMFHCTKDFWSPYWLGKSDFNLIKIYHQNRAFYTYGQKEETSKMVVARYFLELIDKNYYISLDGKELENYIDGTIGTKTIVQKFKDNKNVSIDEDESDQIYFVFISHFPFEEDLIRDILKINPNLHIVVLTNNKDDYPDETFRKKIANFESSIDKLKGVKHDP